MKYSFILLLLYHPLCGQDRIAIRPTFSNSTLNMIYGARSNYAYGGTGTEAPSPGIDLDIKLKQVVYRKKGMEIHNIHNTSNISLLTGVYYSHHYFSVRGLTNNGDGLFSKFNCEYINVPLLYKYNLQPFILNENFHINGAIGLMNSFLLKSHLHEEATVYTRDNAGKIISEQLIRDDSDVTKYGKKYTTSIAVELSVSFKRLYVGERAFFSFKDQYMKDLPNDWAVPSKYSVYISAHDSWHKLLYSGGFFFIGWKVN